MKYCRPHPEILLADGAGFARRLEWLMIRTGTTQAKLAQAVGMDASSISSYITDRRTPTLAIGAEIAKFFGVTLDWLAGLSEDGGPA